MNEPEPTVINPNLSAEPLGNLFQLHVTGTDQTGRVPWDYENPASMAWREGPANMATVECTLSVDDALDLRNEITNWLVSLGVND